MVPDESVPRLETCLPRHCVEGALAVLRQLEGVEEHVRLNVEVLAEVEDQALPRRRGDAKRVSHLLCLGGGFH